MAGDVFSCSKTLVGSVTQKPLWDSAVGQELDVPEHHEPTQGPAGHNETTAPAARQEGTVRNAMGQNQ